MSHAMQALIVIRLDARQGEWVSVKDLASHFGCAAAAVLAECKTLRSQRMVEARFDGADIDAVRTSLRPRDLSEMASAWGFAS